MAVWSIWISLSTWLTPRQAGVRARLRPGGAQPPRQGLGQRLVDQRALARSAHAGHANQRRQRHPRLDALEVVGRDALDHQRPRLGDAPSLLGQRNRQLAAQVAAGHRVAVGGHFRRRAFGHDLAAVQARAGPDVDQVVGGAHDRFIVLDHQHRVTLLLQAAQRVDQPLVVALVQADRRLVENVAHADQPRANAGGQPHALQLAAAERVGRAVERQVFDAHPFQKVEPLVDFLKNRPPDRLVLGRQFQRRQPTAGLADAHRRDFVNRQAMKAAATGLGLEPRPAAILAHHHAAQRFELRPPGRLHRSDELLLQQVQQAHEPAAVAVHQLFACFWLELVDGRLPVEAGRSRERSQLRAVAARFGRRGILPPRHRPVGQRQAVVGHHQLGVELLASAQPLARRAGAVRTVETERARFELFEADLAVRTGVQRAVKLLVPRFGRRGLAVRRLPLRVAIAIAIAVGGAAGTAAIRLAAIPIGAVAVAVRLQITCDHRAFAVRQRQPHRLGQSRPRAFANDDPVDDRFDLVILARGQLAHLVEIQQLAIDAHPDEARLAHGGQHLFVLSLAAADQRGHHDQLRARGQLGQVVDDLLGRLLPDRRAALMTRRLAQPREQQPQVVVNLRDRGHRAPRVLAARPLIDRDRRLQPVDQVDVGPFHLVQELPGVDRQAFDVLPLPLGKQGVEGQRAFARPAGPGDDDHPVAGEVEVDVLEVMNAGPANADHLAVGQIVAGREPRSIAYRQPFGCSSGGE